jgi:hypothetical protein
MWFYQPETQIHLMEVNHLKRLRGVFGIANGFSALKDTNEKELHKPQMYPLFVEHIPQEEQLIFSPYYSKDWKAFKKAFINEITSVITQKKPLFNFIWPLAQ